MSVGNIRKLQENTAALYTERKTLHVSAIRGSGYVWPEKLKRPSLPSGCEISRAARLSGSTPSGFPRVEGAMSQGGPSACARCRDPSPGWHESAQGYPDQLHPDSPRGHVACFPIRTPSGRSTWNSWTSHPDDSISYPDVLSRSLT